MNSPDPFVQMNWKERQNAPDERIQALHDRAIQERLNIRDPVNDQFFNYNCKVVHNPHKYVGKPPKDTW